MVKKDERSERGVYWFLDGDIYIGFWDRDVFQGKGVYRYVNGDKYIGDFK